MGSAIAAHLGLLGGGPISCPGWGPTDLSAPFSFSALGAAALSADGSAGADLDAGQESGEGPSKAAQD